MEIAVSDGGYSAGLGGGVLVGGVCALDVGVVVVLVGEMLDFASVGAFDAVEVSVWREGGWMAFG